MRIITLISDWGYRDLSLAIMKGMLYSSVGDCQIVDLYHDIDVMQHDQAPFMLGHLYSKFPVGSLHVSLVGVSSSMAGRLFAMHLGGHFFIAFDEDLMSVLAYGHEEEAEIRVYKGDGGDSMQKMADLAAACVDGSWKEQGEAWSSPRGGMKPLSAQVFADSGRIIGDIIYVDDHNNIVTDISAEAFMKVRANFKSFSATVGTTKVERFHSRYEDDIFPYFMPNDLGMIQIVMYGGKVTMLPRWAQNTNVEVVFG